MSKRAEQKAEEYDKSLDYYDYISDHLGAIAYREGYEQAEKELGWHSVKESLPPIEEEVIVLTDDIHGKIVPNSKMICYGHRPNPNGWDGKNMETGKVTHYTPKTYDGWNVPGVTHWMPCPKLED